MADGQRDNSAGRASARRSRQRGRCRLWDDQRVRGAHGGGCGFSRDLSVGGGVAANSIGVPDLGISTMEDVLTDVRRITDACLLPLLADIDTGWGGAFNIARTIRQTIKAGAAAVHIEDQVSAKRCGHRPGKELVAAEEMVDRIKAAVDARTDPEFVIMARTDALAGEGWSGRLSERRRTWRPGRT